MPLLLSPSSSIHPVFSGLIARHLAGGALVEDHDIPRVLAQSSAEQRLALALAVSQAFSNVDRELDHAMDSLDQSMNEAASLNQELKGRAESLESALAEKELALHELSQAKVQLLNQEKLASIGTLAAGVAHEINTPTQFVSDNLSFLKDAFDAILSVVACIPTEACTEPVEVLAKIQASAKAADLAFFTEEIPGALKQSSEGMDRVAHIVRSMKEFSHPGKSGKQAVDLNHNILSTITVCRNEWKYVAELDTDLAEDLPLVPCAPNEINQVVLNLVVNAVHAIQDSGKLAQGMGSIKIKSARDGAGVRVDISDSGCGIPEAIQGSIFNPFFTTKEVGRGTGQGLALAFVTVVEKHQGRLTFDTVPGQGTTFHLWLPLTGSVNA